jgi:hypothetical protein
VAKPIRIQAGLVAPSGDFVRVHGRTIKRQAVGELQGTAGDKFKAWVEGNVEIAAAATQAGVGAGTEGLKTDLRNRIHEAGLGEKLPNAVRSQVYPGGGRTSLKAAGWIYTKGKRTLEILEAYANGATIRAKGGRYLAIPTPAAGKAGGSARMTPAAWRYLRGTPLRLVAPRGKPYLLLVTRLRQSKGKRGGYRNPSPAALKRKDFDWVVVFILVKQVEVRRRLNVDGLGEFWAGQVPALIERALPDNL